jgi:hypothetical protein
MEDTGRSGSPSRAGWLVLTLLLVLEWGLFSQYVRREIAWAYPTSYDQTVYLAQAYETYQGVLDHGLAAGLWEGASRRTPQGMLLRPEAALLFLLTGPSRLGALSLNFAAFAVLQAVLAGTLLAVSRSWRVAVFGVGLLLAAATPFSWPGGLADFRLDFQTFCLFGVFLCLVVRSRAFADWRWSLAAGGCGAALVLLRFLCLVYLVGIFGATFLGLGAALWPVRHDAAARGRRLRQLGGLTVAGALLLALALPVLWHNRSPIYHYYAVGHVLGPEKLIRAREAGVEGVGAMLLYYPRSLAGQHLGTAFLLLGGGTVLAGAVAAWLTRRAGVPPSPRPVDGWTTALFVAVCLVVPLAALTLDVAKSPIVANVLVAPVLWLVLLPVLRVAAALPAGGGPRPARWGLTALAALGLGAGLWTQLDGFSRASPLRQDRQDSEEVVRLFDTIARYSGDVGREAPRISVDAQHDYLCPLIAASVGYERHHLLLRPETRLGGTIFAVTEPEAVAAVLDSDFVVLTTPRGRDESSTAYPFGQSIAAVRPRLAALCREKFLPLDRFHFYDTDVVLYARPSLKLDGDSAGWITSRGLNLTGSAAALRAFPNVELTGRGPARHLPAVVGVGATVRAPGRQPKPVAAAMTRSGNTYRINLTLAPQDLPASGEVTLHLTFDAFFVPRDLGLSTDARELVVRTPEQVTLDPAP